MLVTPVVNDAPYPISGTCVSNGGKLLVEFSGSAWTGSGGKISVDLLMDGNVIATASVFTNEPNSHKALVPVAVLVPAAAGSHTFTVRPAGGTNVDLNDYFTVTVTESAPNHFESGVVTAGYLLSPGWPLTDPGGPKVWRETISFAKPFNVPPQVVVGFSILDIDHEANTRVRVEVQNITNSSFDLVYSKWDNSVVYTISANWLAFGDAQ